MASNDWENFREGVKDLGVGAADVGWIFFRNLGIFVGFVSGGLGASWVTFGATKTIADSLGTDPTVMPAWSTDFSAKDSSPIMESLVGDVQLMAACAILVGLWLIAERGGDKRRRGGRR